MNLSNTIFILGSGAIGLPLAAYLTNAGRTVVAVRTSKHDVPKSTISVTVQSGANRISALIECISLDKLVKFTGILVIATKSYTNRAIALALKEKGATGPLIIMQNGVGIEKPFLDTGFTSISRCVLYVTSEAGAEYNFTFRPIAPSPIGMIHGSESGLRECVELLTTDGFPFRAEADIKREIWRKAIINSVFNSICPLLEVDNGVFARDEETASLARQLVRECLMVTNRLNIGLSETDVMQHIMRISKGSNQLISTLQDIRRGRETEIEFLNLEIVRVAASLQPQVHLPGIELLGKMILAKSLQQRRRRQQDV